MAQNGEEDKDKPGGRAPAVGSKAPEFNVKSMSAKTVDFPADYKGKIVLIDFWATWCPPCRAEIPHLRAAYDDYHKQGLEIIGVSLDKARGVPADKVHAFAKENKVGWELVYDGVVSIAKDYHIEFIPAPFLVDGDSGKVLATGEELTGKALAKTIKKHLTSKAGKP
jgi:peroxiredoxin